VSDFSLAWTLSRQRLVDTISDLSGTQLNWPLHESALTIAQMSVHVAGVEVSFASQLTGTELSGDQLRLKKAATEGVVNDMPFPYSASELTPENVMAILQTAKDMLWPIIESPSEEVLQKEIVSALGPVITGAGALARLSFHAAYHQGQAYLIRTAPGFPAS